MKKSIKILIIIALTASSGMAYAQDALNTGYFTDGYVFRHKLNPAFGGVRNYISIPAVNAGVGVQSNMGVSTFLYPMSDGTLTTFLSPEVGAEEFLSKLQNSNSLYADVNTNLYSMGIRNKRGNLYHTFNIGMRSNNSVALPYDLFKFVKAGASMGNTYDLSGIGIKSRNFMEVSYGISVGFLDDRLRFGIKLKGLIGAVMADAKISRLDATLAEDKWELKGEGDFNLALKGVEIGTDENGIYDFNNITAFEDLKQIGPAGYGAALDFGFSWEIIRNLTLSASVLDLGFMSWNNLQAGALPETSWTFSGFENLSVNGDNSDMDSQLSELGEGLKEFTKIRKTDDSKLMEMLAMTANVGLEYVMPFYKGLSVGALATAHIDGDYTYGEGRVSLNLAPLRFLSLSGSYAYSSFGHTIGAMLNFHANCFNIYLGTDTIPTRITPQGAPVGNLNAVVHLGVNITYGKYRGRLKKVSLQN